MGTIIYILFAFASFVAFSNCDKYDLPDMEAEHPFRMAKINMIWDKAKKAKDLDEKRMAELFADLTLQDKSERELKHRRTDATDPDGLFEAGVRRDLNDILRRYKLQAHFSNDRNNLGDRKAAKVAYAVKDENLKNLLKDAKKEGFTAEEIETLKQELGHHQMKLDEYDALQTEYDMKHENIDNSLDKLDEQDGLWRELHNKNKVMKQKHKELKKEYHKLQMKTNRETAQTFEDPRVIHLWTLAKKSGMGEEELESVRTELTHFESRIKKTKYIKEEMEARKEKIQNAGNFDTEHLERRQKDMLERAENYEAMVEKHHADIKTRIQKRIDEL